MGIIGYQYDFAVDLDLVRKSDFLLGRREYNAYDWIRYSGSYLDNLGTIENDFTPEEFLQGPHLTSEDFALPLTEDGIVGSGGAVNVSITYYGDGDTTTVSLPNSATSSGFIASRESVRYLAINCPEIQHGDYIDAEPWGYAAKDYNNELLSSATAFAVSTSKNYTIRDVYGRLLGYIWVAFNENPQPEDYFNMSYLMVKEGYASLRFLGGDQTNDQMYYRDVTYTNFIRNAEILATDLGLKIHGEIDPDFDY
jgi:endonuclease YncB( thermonuclease family)